MRKYTIRLVILCQLAAAAGSLPDLFTTPRAARAPQGAVTFVGSSATAGIVDEGVSLGVSAGDTGCDVLCPGYPTRACSLAVAR